MKTTNAPDTPTITNPAAPVNTVWLIADDTTDRSDVLRQLTEWGYNVTLLTGVDGVVLTGEEQQVGVCTLADWELPDYAAWLTGCKQTDAAVLVLSRPPYTDVEQLENLHSQLKPQFSTRFYSVNMATLHPDEVAVKLALLLGQPVPATPITLTIETFGFRYGMPTGHKDDERRTPDWVMDVRFLPNPYYDPELRSQTGHDIAVTRFLNNQAVFTPFMDHLTGMVTTMLPAYYNQGKRQLYMAIGCTGGQHRSVAVANQLHQTLQQYCQQQAPPLFPNVTLALHHREEPHWHK